MTNNRRRLMLLQAAAPSTTVYVEQDFTATTSGLVTASSPSINTPGGSWVFASASNSATFQGDGSGVEFATTTDSQGVFISGGQEDVQVVAEFIPNSAFSTNRHVGVILRGDPAGNNLSASLNMMFDGGTPWSDLNLILIDGSIGGAALKTWDLSTLTGTTIGIGQTIRLVVQCEGNDITLVSVTKNGTPYTINDTFTLTGTPATGHGAGSGRFAYGVLSNERVAAGSERFRYFKIESIP